MFNQKPDGWRPFVIINWFSWFRILKQKSKRWSSVGSVCRFHRAKPYSHPLPTWFSCNWIACTWLNGVACQCVIDVLNESLVDFIDINICSMVSVRESIPYSLFYSYSNELGSTLHSFLRIDAWWKLPRNRLANVEQFLLKKPVLYRLGAYILSSALRKKVTSETFPIWLTYRSVHWSRSILSCIPISL